MTTVRTDIQLEFRHQKWVGLLGPERTLVQHPNSEYNTEGLSKTGQALIDQLVALPHIYSVVVDGSTGGVAVRIIARDDAAETFLGVNAAMAEFEFATTTFEVSTEWRALQDKYHIPFENACVGSGPRPQMRASKGPVALGRFGATSMPSAAPGPTS